VTTKGRLVLELFEDTAPNAVAGVVSLVEAGFYDGLPWHRVLPNLLAETGDPAARPGAAPGAAHDPGWRLRDDPDTTDPAKVRGHFRGTVSLVRDGPDSAGSQLFITLMPAAQLDGRHLPVGRVVEGQAVADRLEETDRVERAKVLRERDHPYVPVHAPAREEPAQAPAPQGPPAGPAPR
jgi:cyclophilin family peptidyl-prolyl cis-trans isomerase